VARWFNAAGQAVLGSPAHHYPANDPKRADLGWGPVTTQQVLDVALAWAVLNRHFENRVVPPGARRRHQHQLEHARAGEHPS
jgi:hypothetical protein